MMVAATHDTTECNLPELFAGIVEAETVPDLTISGLALDSRKVEPGYLFLACAGTARHGIHFIEQGIDNGAVAVAYESGGETEGLDSNAYPVPVFPVARLHWQASELAGRFYAEPSEAMKVVGITGTNGKTSVSQFIAQAINDEAGSCGVVGTLGSGLYGKLNTTGHTTPDAITVQQQLAQMRDAGAGHVAMEISSHALDQGRVEGIHFDVAVFTNLSHEHLDYHGDMHSYARAKQRLLTLPGVKKAVINADEPVGRDWLKALPGGVEAMAYAIDEKNRAEAALYGDGLRLGADGLAMQVHYAGQSGWLQSGLLGRFNASNLLAALGAMLALGFEFAKALSRLAQVKTVPGRMEAFGGGDKPLVVVDYAHTPAALEHVLEALREHSAGRLWCIFGCGGERDSQKRPLMGQVAERLADSVIVTDDNPRHENPYSIIEEIVSGAGNPDSIYIRRDRRRAIAHAIELCGPGDVILVAGKGHEQRQQIGDELLPFSDRREVAALLGEEVGDE